VQPCTLTAAVCEGCSSTLIEVLRGAGLKVNPLGLTFTVDNYELVANCLAHHAPSILAAGVNPVNFALGFAVCPGPTPGWYQWESSRVSALAALAKIDEERAARRRAVALGAGLGGGGAGLIAVLVGYWAVRRIRRRQADAMREGAAPGPATRLLRSDEVTLFDLIGSGGYASVYRGDWRGASVAVKCFSPTLPASLRPAMVAEASVGSGASLLAGIGSSSSGELSTSDRAGLLQELRVLSALRHPNVCALYGAVSRPPMLVIELAPAGSLAALLERASLRSLPWRARVATIGAGVACGVEFLHAQSPPVIHGDLKSANVVLTSELVPKLCDFGLSRVLPALRVGGAGVDANPRRIGTPRFMAPELVLGVPVVHAEAIDAYGAGVVLYDLAHLGITGDMMAPASSSSMVTAAPGVDETGSSWGSMGSTAPPVSVMLARMRSSFAVDISPGCPAPLADVIRRLLAVEPADRPDIAEVRLKLQDMVTLTDSW
jgi:serine/threonine protein kinase